MGANQLDWHKVKLAMAVRSKNPHWKLSEIKARHWIETGKRCGIADMETIIADLVSRTAAVIDRVQAAIPKGFPAQIADTILHGVRASSERLQSELSGKGWAAECKVQSLDLRVEEHRKYRAFTEDELARFLAIAGKRLLPVLAYCLHQTTSTGY